MSQVITRQSPIKKKRPGPICLSCRYLISPSRFGTGKNILEGLKRELSSRLCVLSCPAKVSIRTVCCHCLAKARVCPTAAVLRGDHTGETMAKLLDELGRSSKPAIPPSFSPCPLALADRDRREALRDQQSLTAAFFGDPLPGMSALDRRERERPH